MTLLDWILRPFVRLQLNSGNETILQGVGLLTEWSFDKDFGQPALFCVPDTITGNIEVVYWNGTTEIIDAQFLSGRNMLIRQIKAAGTAIEKANIRLEV